MNKENRKGGFTVVLVSRSWKGKRSVKERGWAIDRKAAEEICRQWQAKSCACYQVLGPRRLAALRAKIKEEQTVQRAKGAKKAAATRKTNGGTNFILCPKCGAKSKKLRSEFGGLQTRLCHSGHRFEFDKWLADRPLWGL